MSQPALPDNHDPDLAQLLEASAAALARGDHEQGAEQASLAVERALVARSPDADGGRALDLLAAHQWRLGHFEDAAMTARRALVVWQRLDDGPRLCATQCLLATAYTEIGLHEEALRQAAAAFDLARRRHLPAEEALALNRLGICHDRLGDPERGERYLGRALARAREQGSDEPALMALNNLAAVAISAYHLLSERGENSEAHGFLSRGLRYAEQALELVLRGCDVYRQTVVRGNLGELHTLLGHYVLGEQYVRDTILQAEGHGWTAVALRSRYLLGELRAAQGQHDEAVIELQRTLDGLRQREHTTTRMRVHRALHRCYKALGRFEQALAHFESYHELELQRLALQSRAQARLMVNRQDVEQTWGDPATQI